MQPIRIGILGMGTVGGGTAKLLSENAQEITRRLGREVRISMAASHNTGCIRKLCPPDTIVSDDVFQVARSADVDIVVELMGGTDTAREVVLCAIENGKHVVTANKKLLAEYGNEIFALAAGKNVMVMFEAAVAGGIPIIKALREGLAANRIKSVVGIINGTSNFILSNMRAHGSPFAEVLKQAQELGYAEADPTFDIGGHDAAHKLSIMSALTFGTPINFQHCYLEGINKLENQDIRYAEELGYRIKLLAISRKTEEGIELRVHPTLVPECRLLAQVEGVMNAVLVQSNMVGETLYYGAGAGAAPTASAVVADIIDTARLIHAANEQRVPPLAFRNNEELSVLPINEITSSYYLRVSAQDRPGVVADIGRILAEQGISIEALLQKGVINHENAEIVILTHQSKEKHIKAAIAKIEALEHVFQPVMMLRMESLHG
ncbi:homoserine dehydrogenase [Eikenella sp. NML97-A-109]|uniref:homoserine dehydrogenase n=1 Tax=Eikenella sp. NML97-A-109 TaxID=1795833 RepID=UPI0007DF67CA|nr:homoserine dehydrogenase [Eikenella sp. NML97-A-109]OAM41046.1 homoserine dehydrogenase [Eikenella sp. NML97-A-109]